MATAVATKTEQTKAEGKARGAGETRTSGHKHSTPYGEIKELSRTAGNQAVASVVGSDSHGGMFKPLLERLEEDPGRPLERDTRDFMEEQFSRNFGFVRVHTEAPFPESARALNALAYTVGQHIVFGPGQYSPQTKKGERLIAHELTHVVQQDGQSPVTGDGPNQFPAESVPTEREAREASDVAVRSSSTISDARAKFQVNKSSPEGIQRQQATPDVISGADPIISPEAKAFADLAAVLRGEIGAIKSNVDSIGNRSKTFDADIAQFRKIMTWIEKTLTEANQLATEADRAKGSDRASKIDGAGARYEAVLIISQVTHMEVIYVLIADAAEDAGQPSIAGFGFSIEGILAGLSHDMAPLENSVVGFDRKAMAAAASAAAPKFQYARQFLDRWVAALHLGADWSRKAIAAADAILIVAQLYSAGRAIAEASGGPPASFRFPVITGFSGGVATGGVITISAEVLESIRQLIRIGAISAGVVSLGVGPTTTIPTPVGPTVLFRVTPSGTVTPSSGSYAGRSVRYEDGRNKHTKVADNTLSEMQDSLKKPPDKGLLKRFVEAVKARDVSFGSQLSKEGVDQYEKLVKDAVEQGREKAGKFYWKADSEIGIDVETGKATRYYRLDSTPDGAGGLRGSHVIPVDLSKVPASIAKTL